MLNQFHAQVTTFTFMGTGYPFITCKCTGLQYIGIIQYTILGPLKWCLLIPVTLLNRKCLTNYYSHIHTIYEETMEITMTYN